ncbi:hypothetical protein Bpfe_023218, partial [Biomphalaria pfeifferi]
YSSFVFYKSNLLDYCVHLTGEMFLYSGATACQDFDNTKNDNPDTDCPAHYWNSHRVSRVVLGCAISILEDGLSSQQDVSSPGIQR